jgi:hypothetical protein
MAEGELMDSYNATKFLSGNDATSEELLYLNENVGGQEHRNLFDEPFRFVTGIIFAVPISLFFWFIILLIYKAIS